MKHTKDKIKDSFENKRLMEQAKNSVIATDVFLKLKKMYLPGNPLIMITQNKQNIDIGISFTFRPSTNDIKRGVKIIQKLWELQYKNYIDNEGIITQDNIEKNLV